MSERMVTAAMLHACLVEANDERRDDDAYICALGENVIEPNVAMVDGHIDFARVAQLLNGKLEGVLRG